MNLVVEAIGDSAVRKFLYLGNGQARTQHTVRYIGYEEKCWVVCAFFNCLVRSSELQYS